MKRIRLPRGKWSRQQVTKLFKRLLVAVVVVAVLGVAFWAALPWLKEKQIVPVADNERRSPMYSSRDQKSHDASALKNLEAQESGIAKAEPAAQYAYYAEKAEKLTSLERYDEAEQTFVAAEKTGFLASDQRLAEAFYVNFGMMYEAKGNNVKAHEQYLKAKKTVEAMKLEEIDKQISLEEIDLLLDRTKG